MQKIGMRLNFLERQKAKGAGKGACSIITYNPLDREEAEKTLQDYRIKNPDGVVFMIPNNGRDN